jgi:hypothetical protein
MGFKTPFRNPPNETTLNFGAGSYTAGAQNAFVQIYKNKRIWIRINLVARLGRHITVGIKTIEARPFKEVII